MGGIKILKEMDALYANDGIAKMINYLKD